MKTATPGTAVALAWAPPLIDLIAWWTGTAWTRWHISGVHGRTRCGRAIPTDTRATRRHHPAADVCQMCVDVATASRTPEV